MRCWSVVLMPDRWRQAAYVLVVAALAGAMVYGVASGGSHG